MRTAGSYDPAIRPPVGALAPAASYGASIGSNNPNYTVGVDGIVFSTATDTFRNDFGPK